MKLDDKLSQKLQALGAFVVVVENGEERGPRTEDDYAREMAKIPPQDLKSLAAEREKAGMRGPLTIKRPKGYSQIIMKELADEYRVTVRAIRSCIDE